MGILIHYLRLTNMERKHVKDPLEKCLASWKGKLISVGGRLVHVTLVLTKMILHMLLFFQLPKGLLERLDYIRFRFFWQSDNENKTCRRVKWTVVDPKSRVVLVYMTSKLKVMPYSSNGFISFSVGKGSGKLSS